MPTHYRHVAARALEEGLCMGNPEIGAPGCHRPPAEGMRHGRCQECQDIWNLWRREGRPARAKAACPAAEPPPAPARIPIDRPYLDQGF